MKMLALWPARSLAIIAVSALFTSCDSNRVFESNVAIENGIWNSDNVITLEVDIIDTVSMHNLYINLRNTGEYMYSNLYVFLSVTSPEGNVLNDTIECILADPSGSWYGRGAGDVFHNQILFKKGVRFPRSGKYAFQFEQAMRRKSLEHIIDVGLRIEKAQ